MNPPPKTLCGTIVRMEKQAAQMLVFSLERGWFAVPSPVDKSGQEPDDWDQVGYVCNWSYEHSGETGAQIWEIGANAPVGWPSFIVRTWLLGTGMDRGATDPASAMHLLAPILAAAESMYRISTDSGWYTA